jgi:hypothetical protein
MYGIVAERNALCHSGLRFETDNGLRLTEEVPMTARTWRGWAAADNADEIAAHLRGGPLARYAAAPGNVSASLLLRPVAGGIELMTFSVWESTDVVPRLVEEDHRLLVARQTIADCWEVDDTAEAIARAA